MTVILVGAFIAQGMRPGPQLMEEQGSLVFAILIAMVLANILFLGIGYLSIPFFARVVTIRKSFLKCVGIEFNKYHVFNDTDKKVLQWLLESSDSETEWSIDSVTRLIENEELKDDEIPKMKKMDVLSKAIGTIKELQEQVQQF